MEENSVVEEVHEMPDILIPPVEVEMKIGDEIILPSEEDNSAILDEYKKEMLDSGLASCDLEYLCTAYKNLEDVKFIKIHCTSCAKHIGSAPNDLQNRYEHPLLKVLICGECFQFYSSGDFEKDEDGSELYCRWCGEGGQVFCCTKCPFVFCKKCIRRNLGRLVARTIENSDNWMCFSCDPSQISQHRATYWAIQKYSEEMIKKFKESGDDTEILSMDENICCTVSKRRSEVYNKLLQPPTKKQRLRTPATTLRPIAPNNLKTPRQYRKRNTRELDTLWQPLDISQQPEDEVICTPDIIPLEESPPASPLRVVSPPPMIPLMQQATTPVRKTLLPRIPQLMVRPPAPSGMNIADLQNHLRTNYSQIVLAPRGKPPVRPSMANQAVLIRKNVPIAPRMPQNPQNQNGNFRYVGNKPTTSAKKTSMSTSTPNKDWFDKAVQECNEVTDYIKTQLSGITGIHTRAHKSEKLMVELHNTFQTVIHVAGKKISRLQEITKENFQSDMKKNFSKPPAKMVNPFARKKRISTSSSYSDSNHSWDSNYSAKNNKTTRVLTKHIQPDEVLFDMDVTNASDEENKINDSDDDVQLVVEKPEVIQIIDSDDDDHDEPEIVPTEVEATEVEATEVEAPEVEATEVEAPEVEATEVEAPEVEATEAEASEVEATEVEATEVEAPEVETTEVEATEIEAPDNEDSEGAGFEGFKVATGTIQKIKSKFNIKDLPSKELLKFLSPVVIATPKTTPTEEDVDPNIVLQKDEVKKDVQHKLINTIRQLSQEEEDDAEEIAAAAEKDKSTSKDDKDKPQETDKPEEEDKSTEDKLLEETQTEENEELTQPSISEDSEEEMGDFDIEDLLGSTVVVKQNISSNFGDAFSKFVTGEEPSVDDEIIDDEIIDETGEKQEGPSADEKNVKNEISDEEIVEEPSFDDELVEDPSIDENVDEKNVKNKSVEEPSVDDEIVDDEIIDDEIVEEHSVDNETMKAEVGDSKLKNSVKEEIVVEQIIEEPIVPIDDILSDLNIAHELEIIPDYVNELCKRDNGSLSLPPDSISSISVNDMQMLLSSDEKDSDLLKKSETEILLNSEILALQQLAENCVNEHKNSAECKG